MAVFAVGDIQGCYQEFRALLRKMNFRDDCDTLWLTGDLVSRGHDSLSSLRYVCAMGEGAITVLGNHDLHLLALAAGLREYGKAEADLVKVLKARDCDSLMDWLRQRPLLHHDEDLAYTLVHAGLSPMWTLDVATAQTGKVQKALSGDKMTKLLKNMYGNQPDMWTENLKRTERWRYTINACTRMRFCYEDGRLELSQKGQPETAAKKLQPWFELPRPHQGLRIVFGHWSALGLVIRPDLIGLDSGCVWGRSLTGVRLESEGIAQTWSVPCSGSPAH
jgi:bis(5'-nucleosyl)-tetraphosphatase (symmetrical)